MAAARIVAYEGLEALTTRNLAKAMDCSIGVLSHYFSNKDEIVIAALNWADDRIESRFSALVGQGRMEVEQWVPLIKEAFPINETSDMEWRVRINLAAYALTHPVLLESQRKLRKERHQRIHDLIASLQASGALRPDLDIASIANNMIDFVTGTAFGLLLLPMEERGAKVDAMLPYLDLLQQDIEQG